jgi:multisubunit Na+/H+ antiporter MnhB subunit
MIFAIVVILVLLAVGSLPAWPHAQNFGPYPSGVLGLIVVVLLVLLLLGRL